MLKSLAMKLRFTYLDFSFNAMNNVMNYIEEG